MSNYIYFNVDDPDGIPMEQKLEGYKQSYGEDNQIYQNALCEYRIMLLNEYIKYASTKYTKENGYKGLEDIIDALQQYVTAKSMDEKLRAITRDNGFRDSFRIYMTPEFVNTYIGGGNAGLYINHLLFDEKEKIEKVIAACRETYEKYDRVQMVRAVNKALDPKEKDETRFKGFTNDSGNRTYLNDNIKTRFEFGKIISKIILNM